MEYTLHPSPAPVAGAAKPRLVPSRPSRNLRQGGGRKPLPGWTEQKRRTNRRRFDSLRPFIKTGVTIVYPANAAPQELLKLSKCSQEFCAEMKIPARAVWEGPTRHQHIALCIEHCPEIERKWLKRLAKRWLAVLGVAMGAAAFVWKPDIEPDKIASYLLKTRSRKGGRAVMAKGAYEWMPTSPYWETCLRNLAPPSTVSGPHGGKPRKTRGKTARAPSPSATCPLHSPNYTVSPSQTSENEGQSTRSNLALSQRAQMRECPVCWQRWGRSLWEGSCKCNADFPNC